MLTLALDLPAKRRPDVLCVGAHCDDIEIGCGATVLLLQRLYPRCRIHSLILTSTPDRNAEARKAFRALVRPSARGELHIGELRDGHLPAHFTAAKTQFEAMRNVIDPDVIFTHHGDDRHQDHRCASELTWQTFRNHQIWEYEIPKYEGDLGKPNMYVHATAATAQRKLALIRRAFASQRGKYWFNDDNLRALMQLRGLESRAPSGLAEAFHCRKLVFGARQRGSN
jgi:LmbE family N-acetylglucosaminyl deacetylase